MALSKHTAEVIAEKLHHFNPNLNVNIKGDDHKVVATIHCMEMNGEQLKALGEIADKHPIRFDRSGGKVRMVIN